MRKKWDEAKENAKKSGQADNYAYITSIFKKLAGVSASTLPIKIEAASRLKSTALTDEDMTLGEGEETNN